MPASYVLKKAERFVFTAGGWGGRYLLGDVATGGLRRLPLLHTKKKNWADTIFNTLASRTSYMNPTSFDLSIRWPPGKTLFPFLFRLHTPISACFFFHSISFLYIGPKVCVSKIYIFIVYTYIPRKEHYATDTVEDNDCGKKKKRIFVSDIDEKQVSQSWKVKKKKSSFRMRQIVLTSTNSL